MIFISRRARTLLVLLVLFKEGLEGFRAVESWGVLLGVNLLIDNETSQDGVSSHTIDVHENSTNDVSEDEHAHCGDER